MNAGKMFEELEFTQALEELENPDLLEYEFFVESMDIKIYRKYNQVSGLYEYKVFGPLDCSAETCQQVYMDLEYRKRWDSYVAELREVETEMNNSVIYWNVNYPFPLSKRDYSYIRECKMFQKDRKRTWVVLARSCKTSKIPEKKKVVRVDDYKQFMILQEDGPNKTKSFMHYYDNPKGMIPTWLINWAAKTGVPAFLSTMRTACLNYDDYKTKRQQNQNSK